jgi:uncharacterized protein (TIGR02246 family)
MSEVTDVVDAMLDAYRARDVDRLLSHFAEDASVVLFDGSSMMANKQVMRDRYEKFFADSPDLQLSIANRIAVGDFVVDEEHSQNVHFEGMPPDLTDVAVYRVVDGKIAKLLVLL